MPSLMVSTPFVNCARSAVVRAEFEYPLDAIRAKHQRDTDADPADPVLPVEECRTREGPPCGPRRWPSPSSRSRCRGVHRSSLLRDHVDGDLPRALDRLLHLLLVQSEVRGTPPMEVYLASGSMFSPCSPMTSAVIEERETPEPRGEDVLEAGEVQYPAHADDSVLGETRCLQDDVVHDVHGVRDGDDDRPQARTLRPPLRRSR